MIQRVYGVVLFIIFYVLCSVSCQDKENVEISKNSKYELKTLITFKLGEVKKNGEEVSLGDFIEGDQVFSVGRSSFLDLQVSNFSSEVSLRSRTPSEFSIYARKRGEILQLNIFLKKGDLLFSVKKLQKNEEVVVYSPTMKSKVLGTQFKLIVKDDASTNIKVADGQVQVNQSSPALEAISNSNAVSEDKRKTIANMLGEGKVVEVGKELTVTKSNLKETLKDPELIQLLDSPTLQNVNIPTETSQDANLQKELADLEKKIQDTKVGEPTKVALEIKETNTSDIKKEADQIISVADSSSRNKEDIKKTLDESIKANTPVLLNTMSKVLGKNSETLVLKNGQTITGIVYMIGSGYVVRTPNGDSKFTESQISGVRF